MIDRRQAEIHGRRRRRRRQSERGRSGGCGGSHDELIRRPPRLVNARLSTTADHHPVGRSPVDSDRADDSIRNDNRAL